MTENITVTVDVSIHASREGGDPPEHKAPILYEVSIHASREGGDPTSSTALLLSRSFNPRLP